VDIKPVEMKTERERTHAADGAAQHRVAASVRTPAFSQLRRMLKLGGGRYQPA